jgi:hypothetical protein
MDLWIYKIEAQLIKVCVRVGSTLTLKMSKIKLKSKVIIKSLTTSY